ncbi:hypothetical protein FOCC_FOCC008369 [Frankliniella occidentalis]|nr:hypothetical protein FOCC_FOCC008369 [Frankliniella occidentalis]
MHLIFVKHETVLQHIVFLTTAVVSYIIPDVPTEVRTQIQRERLLTKEAKFEHGLHRGKSVDEYDELLYALRERDRGNNSRFGDILRRGSWGRRLSRQSDGTGTAGDSHPDVHRLTTRSSSTATQLNLLGAVGASASPVSVRDSIVRGLRRAYRSVTDCECENQPGEDKKHP